ncbi:MAG TPA: alanine--tRNA ligase, partial [Alphaproteobacteria bacterium]
NEGRNYVLRRIMRRAMRHAHLLGSKTPLMHQLVPVLVNQMGQAYPELIQQQALITDTLYREETRFRETLDRGLKMLDEAVGKLPDGGTLPGEVAFKLYDTYGFPLDLTADILKTKKYQLDEAGFETAMAQQKALARQSWSGSGDKATDKIWFDLQNDVGNTEFLGYGSLRSEAVVQTMVKDGAIINEAKTGDQVGIVLNQTPFYAESGGQVGDIGILRTDNAEIEIIDTRKPTGNYFLHQGVVKNGTLKKGDAVEAIVDAKARRQTQGHHSATHLLHEALRRNLGEHIAQKGSYVAPDRLRLDFSHGDGLTAEQLQQITQDVRDQIAAGTAISTKVMNLDEAKNSGARALFGEKYGDEVRVVGMGTNDATGRAYSIELCGGTHAKNTAEIGAFRIISEGSVSSGVRRIQAVAGITAEKMAEDELALLEKTASLFKAQPEILFDRVQKLIEENQSLNTEIGTLRRKVAMGGGGGAQEIEQVGHVKFVAKTYDDLPVKDLRPLADELKQQIGSGVVVVLTKESGRASIVVGVTSDLTDTISAVDLVNAGAEVLGGKGGGRPDMAQAGGANLDQMSEAIDKIRQKLVA